MKHTLSITILLVSIFFFAQIIGLLVINQYLDHKELEATGIVQFEPLPFDVERPVVEEKTSFVYIVTAVIISTAIVLLLIRWKTIRLWKVWFTLAVVTCLTFAFSKTLGQLPALALSAVLGIWKVFRPNVYIHNITEMFIYAGLAAIFVPIMNLFAATAMLILISIYDMYAVWKSKHMISLAKFQTEAKVFAGISIPYSPAKKSATTTTLPIKAAGRSAILGGGDIGFPLLFAGVVMKGMVASDPVLTGFLKAAIISICAAIALLLLLVKAEKGKFYPAMPFISIGCFLGYALVALIGLV